MKWYWIVLIIISSVTALFLVSSFLYKQVFKRIYDIVLSFMAIIVLSPLLLILTFIGLFTMKGNPFFIQLRPGKINPKTGKEKIFRLIKFRTMSNAKDVEGILLPDEKRLNKYGKLIRMFSLDELPELINILKGDMSIVGPRPLLVKYLERYTPEQRRRHEVRPGFTGLAQVHGRNAITWEEKFDWDIKYVENISLVLDIKIIFLTVKTVLKREGINSEKSVTMEEFMGNKR